MLTSKQRAKLKSIAASADTILHIGKEGISENTCKQAADALRARELIKGKVLETAPYTPREAAELLAEQTGAEVVIVIGTKFVLYLKNPQQPKIEL